MSETQLLGRPRRTITASSSRATRIPDNEVSGIKARLSRVTSLGAATGLSSGMLIGALAGLLVLNPLAGMAVGGLAGAGFGALSGSMTDYGINDEFIKNLGKTIPKGSSALFLLIKRSTPDKVLPEIEPFKPRVLKTSLSHAQEDKLRAAITQAANAG